VLLHRQRKQERVFAIGGAIFNQRADAAVFPIQQASIRYAVQRGGNVILVQQRK
jgi:hypothetical protein